jgi:hypothetical protein
VSCVGEGRQDCGQSRPRSLSFAHGVSSPGNNTSSRRRAPSTIDRREEDAAADQELASGRSRRSTATKPTNYKQVQRAKKNLENYSSSSSSEEEQGNGDARELEEAQISNRFCNNEGGELIELKRAFDTDSISDQKE